MAITIVATSGGSASNSYATEAELASYLEGRLNVDAFTDATTDNQRRALVEAQRALTVLEWQGRRASSTQALAWPRDDVIDPDSAVSSYFSNTVIPQRVKDAQCEMALAYLKAGTTDVAAYDTSLNIKVDKVGPLTTEYFEARSRPSGIARYPEATRYLRGLLVSQNGVTFARGR